MLASTKRVHCKAGATAMSLMGHSLQGRHTTKTHQCPLRPKATELQPRREMSRGPSADVSKRSICCAMISSAGRDQLGAQSPVG